MVRRNDERIRNEQQGGKIMIFKQFLELAILGMAEYRSPAWSQSPRRKLRIYKK